MNKLTSYIDGSVVYGETEERSRALRSFMDGKLKVQPDNLLPVIISCNFEKKKDFLLYFPTQNSQGPRTCLNSFVVYYGTEMNFVIFLAVYPLLFPAPSLFSCPNL